jgi:dihydrofolate reductase
MPRLIVDLSISLDGFVAGPDATLEQPLGAGGERLHEWVVRLAAWRAPHGQEGGETDASSAIFEESLQRTGAYLMGRRMFSGGEGPWADDPNADGWWGDDPPFRGPVVILTSHPREPVEHANGTTFLFASDGIEAALEQAREAAGGKDVTIAGGADVAQQYLRAGLVDEVIVHVASVFLGSGTRLFDGIPSALGLDCTEAIALPDVAHLRYEVRRS